MASWLTGWIYRKSHTLTGTAAGAQALYPMGVKVYFGAGVDGTEVHNGVTFGKVYCDSKCKADFGDIRFTESDEETLLDLWIEEKVDGSYAIIWIEVDNIPINPNTDIIYMYYGNGAVATTSSGDDTFPVFIGMEEGNLNEWTSTYVLAAKSASAEHPHTGSRDIKLIPAAGNPASSGATYDVDAYDDGYAYLVWVYCLPTKVALYAATFRLTDGAANALYLTAHENVNNFEYWDGAGYQDTGIARTTGHHLFEYRVKAASILMVVDGTTVKTTARLTEGDLDFLDVFCYRANPNPSWFDDCLIRKYSDPEPTHTSWGDEEELAGSENLLGTFKVTRPGSEELLGIFTPRRDGSEDLLGIFTSRQTDSENLLGIFSARRDGSQELLAEFFVEAVHKSAELAAEFSVDDTHSITGITKDTAGARLGNCEVALFRVEAGVPPTYTFIEADTSDGNGDYTFTGLTKRRFFVRAQKDGSPNVFDTTDNELEPV